MYIISTCHDIPQYSHVFAVQFKDLSPSRLSTLMLKDTVFGITAKDGVVKDYNLFFNLWCLYISSPNLRFSRVFKHPYFIAPIYEQ